MRTFLGLVFMCISLMLVSCTFTPQTPQPSFAPLSDKDLLAYFSFDETLEGILKGSVVEAEVCGGKIVESGGNIVYEVGKKGKAAVFDGKSGIILPQRIVEDYDYTILFWVNVGNFTDHTPTIFADTNKGWISFFVPKPWWRGEGEPAIWSFSQSQWSTYNVGSLISKNTWYHIAIVVDSGKPSVYVNGSPVELESIEGKPLPDIFTEASDCIVALGVNRWDTPFNGLIDELFIFNRPLKPHEIKTIYYLSY